MTDHIFGFNDMTLVDHKLQILLCLLTLFKNKHYYVYVVTFRGTFMRQHKVNNMTHGLQLRLPIEIETKDHYLKRKGVNSSVYLKFT